MALTKTTRVNGTTNVSSGQEIYVDFAIPEANQPISVSFSAQIGDVNLNGMFYDSSISNYNVTNGKIESTLLDEIEECIDGLKTTYLV
jgi:hypothetical protein